MTLNKLTADQFRSLCDEVAYWRESLSGARASEVVAEAERLQRMILELESARLARRNPELEQRRGRILESARRTLARRMPVLPQGADPKRLEDEIAEHLESEVELEAGRYMLVDNRTGEDMRPAHDFEVRQIQSKRHGIAMLELGGTWNTPARLYEVRLRDTQAPKVKRGPIPDMPGVRVTSRHFYFGEIVGNKLYIDERSYPTLEQALADVKPRGWPVRNGVIAETQQLASAAGSLGARQVLHSIIDGQILDDRFLA